MPEATEGKKSETLVESSPQSNTEEIPTSPIKKASYAATGVGIVIGGRSLVDKLTQETTEPFIHFEAGIHSAPEMYESIVNAFNNGENVHFWNKEVSQRITQYQPKVLAIDGLSPFEVKYPRACWVDLPDRVNKINNSSEIYLIAGDAGDSFRSNEIFVQLQNKGVDITDEVIKDIDNNGSKIQQVATLLPSLLTGPVLKAGLGLGLGKLLLNYSERNHKTKDTRKFNRRTFLKGAAVGLLGTFAPFTASPIVEALSPDEGLKTVLQQTNSALRPEIKGLDVFTNGRTALLIEKEEEALSYLKSQKLIPQNSTGSVVMGIRHNYEAINYLNSPSQRHEAIVVYATELIQNITLAISNYISLSEKDKSLTINNILDDFCTIPIIKVTDSGENFPNPNLPDYIDKNTTLFETRTSSTIYELTQHLRP